MSFLQQNLSKQQLKVLGALNSGPRTRGRPKGFDVETIQFSSLPFAG